jgi:hypothetical protein
MQARVPVWAGLAVVLVGIAAVPDAQERPRIGDAVSEVEQLDALRSGLAGAFGERGVPADQEAFQHVCRPVGIRARDIAERNGWTVQQLAAKYRNPANALDREAEHVYDMMRSDPALSGIWVRTSMQGREGVRYFRRIVVEEACLACHGAGDDRPAFVRQNYPDDRAYDFGVGDLRGVYAVFLPTSDRADGRPE